MPTNPVSRRDVLRTLAMGAMGGSVLQLIPLQAAEQVHHMVKQERAHAPAGKYRPKFFPAHQYATLGVLCDAILPADEHSGGAVQAGAPEFIDLLTSENKDYQLALGGGFMWLDGLCGDRYGHPYLACSAAQQREILDLMAYRKSALTDAALSQGVEFFAFLRRLTSDAFYSSEVGIRDLQYIGNTFVKEFPGCPPVPEA
ncbi:MAG: gluconate 2-dehydrogenase subunit 3 family protein [Terriglobales bacterium]